MAGQRTQRRLAISIHALLAESDICPFSLSPVCKLFLSTLSLRRATESDCRRKDSCSISIHALLAESDSTVSVCTPSSSLFLSTLSLRRATEACPRRKTHIPRFLSTLSLRRATTEIIRKLKSFAYFYPRSPCGERPWLDDLAKPCLFISIHALLAESDILE